MNEIVRDGNIPYLAEKSIVEKWVTPLDLVSALRCEGTRNDTLILLGFFVEDMEFQQVTVTREFLLWFEEQVRSYVTPRLSERIKGLIENKYPESNGIPEAYRWVIWDMAAVLLNQD